MNTEQFLDYIINEFKKVDHEVLEVVTRENGGYLVLVDDTDIGLYLKLKAECYLYGNDKIDIVSGDFSTGEFEELYEKYVGKLER